MNPKVLKSLIFSIKFLIWKYTYNIKVASTTQNLISHSLESMSVQNIPLFKHFYLKKKGENVY